METNYQTYKHVHQKYEQSAKAKARRDRYNRSDKGKARSRKFIHTEKGKIAGQRRLRLSERYFGVADTPEQAAAINAHLKERLSVFKQRFAARAQAEGATASAVQTQTEL